MTRSAWVLAFLFVASVACGGGGGDSARLRVFAAASLGGAFEDIGESFEASHEGVQVEFNFAGSQELRTQLEQGAEADVFASADERQMRLAEEAGVVHGDVRVFARNGLVVVVPAENGAGINGLSDLARPGLKLVIAGEDVPIGAYTREFLQKAEADPGLGPSYAEQVLANVVSEENNVRQVLARVQLGEADAGVVYRSDVTAELAHAVRTIEIPDEVNVLAEYLAAPTSGAEDSILARDFIDFLLGEEAQSILASKGFLRGD